jgi:transposase
LTIDNIDVAAAIKKVQQLIAEEAILSPALRSTLDVLILVVQLLANRLSLNSCQSASKSIQVTAPSDVQI